MSYSAFPKLSGNIRQSPRPARFENILTRADTACRITPIAGITQASPRYAGAVAKVIKNFRYAW
ncbi:MAG: hypothetical protein ABL887_06995 [Nitrosomonas sp.]